MHKRFIGGGNARKVAVVPTFLGILITLSFAASVRADFPPRPTAQTLAGGIQLFGVALTGDGPGTTMTVWVYLPPGEHAVGSLPCVFTAPSGSTLMVGMKLAAGDRPEHLPYAQSGFAVVAYELDGPGGRYVDPVAIKKFMAAHGGIDNAKTAIDFALARFPEIAPDRLYTAGHSSAATVALDVAAAEPRVKACCAYAPCPNLPRRFGPARMELLNRQIPGFAAFADAASPDSHVPELVRKPVLLFTAADDRNVPTQWVKDFAEALESARGKHVKLVTTETGGHFQSMMDEGIPAGIAFLKEVDADGK